MRMIFTEHIAHHAGRLDRLGRHRQGHAMHGVQDAPLHRFHAIAQIGQRPTLDHRDRVVQVGSLGEIRQRELFSIKA